MNSQQRRPRRPAMLDPADAEQIVGDSDPAEMSAIAHSSAWALMGVSDDDFGPDEIERLRTTVRTEGVDVLTDMWSRSPEFTLPGALWRLYLWSRWYHRDTALVRDRFVRGSHADIIPGLEHPVDIPDLEHVVHEVDQLLEGRRHDDDLADIITATSRAMRIVAAGDTEGGKWIVDPRDPLAYPVTTRARALIQTADELDRSAEEAHIGALN